MNKMNVYILVNIGDLDNSCDTRGELENYAIRGVFNSLENALYDLATDEGAMMSYMDIEYDDTRFDQYAEEFMEIVIGLDLYSDEIFDRINWTIIERILDL